MPAEICVGDFNFKGFTARRIYKSFGVKGLMASTCYEHYLLILRRCCTNDTRRDLIPSLKVKGKQNDCNHKNPSSAICN
jgi:hypothetical protein